MVLLRVRFSQPLPQIGGSWISTACLGGMVLGAFTGALLGIREPTVAAPIHSTQAKQTTEAGNHQVITLGVAFSPDRLELRTSLAQRLGQLNYPFQVIEWDQMNRLDDLDGIDILFLPDVRTISSRQVRVLEDWLEQGGRVIVSGHLGGSSSSSVQAQLRSLLGAYWAFALPEASPLRVINRQFADHEAIGALGNERAIAGGVIVPTGLESRTLATWQTSNQISVQQEIRGTTIARRVNIGSAGAPAIIRTEHATFLGWHWGSSDMNDAAFDRAWLRAVLESTAENALITSASSTSSLADRSPAEPQSSVQSSVRSSSIPLRLQRPAAEPQPSPIPQQSAQQAQQADEPSAQAVQPEAPLPITPTSDEEFVDPTQQIAPAGLDVELTERPISMLEKISMSRELENLIGRFESALIASRVYEDDREDGLGSVDQLLVASTSNPLGIARELVNASAFETYARITEHPALVQARMILDEFPDLVDQHRHGEARQQWLEARQLLWENFPRDRPIAQPEVRAIWLDRGTIIEAGSRRRLALIFDRLVESGINTVFVETVNAGYPIYPSQVAPEQNPLVHNWDPLEAAVELAHERGMEAHAWVWVFAVGNQRHNVIANLPWSYPGPILAANPDWANADRHGRAIPLGQDKPFLDPAHPEVRRYLLSLYEEIVTEYDVDGLQLDYIRYPFQNAAAGNSYGYGRASRRQFQRLTGVDPLTLSPSDRDLWRQWTEFRTEQVNSFVADTAEHLRRLRPDIILSAAVFAMSEHERIQKLQQHWEVWAREGTVDMIVTMSYALDTPRFQQLTTPWLLEADLGSTLVVPGIQLLNLPELAALDQIQSLRDMPAGGYALFAVEHLNDELSSIFSRTQGVQQMPLAPVPFREPLMTAAIRFEALQREWAFMIESGELWMRDAQRQEWQAKSESLQEVLNSLADDPSAQEVEQAQQAFTAFRDRFADWMYLQSLRHGYRVRIWEYRLEMIDDLLSYGGDRL